MANWESEKQTYLSMDMSAKRKNYKSFIELKNIPTWREYVIEKSSKILPKIDLLPGNSIDSSKNEQLAEKISYFTGDITTLEVDYH